MDAPDTFVFIFSIVDGMTLLFLTVYFVSLDVFVRNIAGLQIGNNYRTQELHSPHYGQ